MTILLRSFAEKEKYFTMDKNYNFIVNEWLEKADSDFRYAKMSFENFDDFYAQICVLCHDAAEKYLKAYLIYHNLKPEKIHDLVTLHKQCIKVSENDTTSARIEEECRLLNQYYIPLKYPSHYPAVDRKKAKEAIEAIEVISKTIKNKIKFSE